MINIEDYRQDEENIYLDILSLCDGMSCGYIAFQIAAEYILRKTGKKVHLAYFAIENNKQVRKLSDSNFKNLIYRPCHDINDITAKQMLLDWGRFDFVLFGSPCQSLSNAGDRRGLNGKSGLLFKCMEILALAQFKNPKVRFLAENVKMEYKFKQQFDTVFGRQPVLINSSLLSAQGRERYYWVNFPVEQPKNSFIPFRLIREDGRKAKNFEKFKISKKYCTTFRENIDSDKIKNQLVFKYSESNRYIDKNGKRHQKPGQGLTRFVEKRLIPSDKSLTLLATGKGCGSFNKSINLVATAKPSYYRRLTIRECARLQTIPDWYNFDSVSSTQAYMAIGNGWTVDVIAHIFKSSFQY